MSGLAEEVFVFATVEVLTEGMRKKYNCECEKVQRTDNNKNGKAFHYLKTTMVFSFFAATLTQTLDSHFHVTDQPSNIIYSILNSVPCLIIRTSVIEEKTVVCNFRCLLRYLLHFEHYTIY